MVRTRETLVRFNAGEISPELFGRIDIEQFRAGAKTLRNMLCKPQGGARNRPGFRFVAEVKDRTVRTRLRPFIYDVDQSLVLEFGEQYVRFFSDGGKVLVSPAYRDYTAEVVFTWGIGSPRIIAPGHTFEEGDRCEITSSAGAVYPSVISPSGLVLADNAQTFYVQNVTAGVSFDIVLEPGGAFINMLVSGATGTFTIHRLYGVGDKMTTGGLNYYCTQDHLSAASPTLTNPPWYAMPATGELEIPHDIQAANLFAFDDAQSADVLRIADASLPMFELSRRGATDWTNTQVSFGSTLPAPSAPSVTASRGAEVEIVLTGYPSNPEQLRFNLPHDFAKGDPVFVRGAGLPGISEGVYIVADDDPTNNGLAISLKSVANGALLSTTSVYPGSGVFVSYASLSSETEQFYAVTSINADGVESTRSAEGFAANLLEVPGAFNTLTWLPVFGAERYRVYKKSNGLYGYIGEVESGPSTLVFKDENIGPDFDVQPPLLDSDLIGAGQYPRAVAFWQQRGWIGGTNPSPQVLWGSRIGARSDFTYSLVVQPDDRISVELDARENHTVRHLVPIGGLVALTQSGEWSIRGENQDVVTPETINTDNASYIGASAVQPVVVDNVLVFAANRGGHVYQLGYNFQSRGYVPDNLSLKAAHLFERTDIEDMGFGKSPYPTVWCVSSDGRLLSMTYMPRENIVAWSWHETDGIFESVAVVPEGDEDIVYVVVKRIINGVERRYIERMAPQRISSVAEGVYLDSALTFDGTNTTATTLTVTGGVAWTKGERVTVTASASIFDSSYHNNDLEVRDSAGTGYRLRVLRFTGTAVEAQLLVDLPAELRATATASWARGRRKFTGLGHLEGETVGILADGKVQAPQKVINATIEVDFSAVLAHAGLPYVSDLETLPLALQADVAAGGRGREKNLVRAWPRVFETAGLQIGPNEQDLVPLLDLNPELMSTGEYRVQLKGDWNLDRTLLIRQTRPLPMTVTSITLEVNVGD